MSSLDGDFRGKPRHDDEGHGSHAEMEVRWLLPYADMVTLLFALFIVLFAISSVNNTKLEVLQKSLSKAFNGSKPTPGQSPSQTKSPLEQDPGAKLLNAGVSLLQLQEAAKSATERQQEDERLRAIQRKIRAFAREKGLQSKLDTVIDERGLAIRLISDKVLFDEGRAELKDGIKPIIRQITEVVKTTPNPIRVEGHTDSVPVGAASPFETNWELSAARATSVVRALIRDGMSPGRLSAAGYAYRRPLKSNDTLAGRQRNRRVEIVVLRNATLLGNPDVGSDIQGSTGP